VRQFGAFPVYRERFKREALRQVQSVFARGKCLGMFPEGKRSAMGMTAAQMGSALIACRNKVSIIPVGLAGTEKIRGYRWFWNRPEIFVNIGRPFTLPEYGHHVTREQLNEATSVMMQKVAELLPEKYQGMYKKEG
jgi:1-acyl-sn-glycerol-3-phosphate acyltransferase